MALKPTIFKFRIALTDMNRDYYDSLNLTIAQHPSENNQRMMARILAFCLNAQESLQFTKGLSTIEEPDIWLKSLDDQIQLWIDVGEPDPERIKKSSRLAKQVKVYSFNTKSNVWWSQNQGKIGQYKADVVRFDAEAVEQLGDMVERSMELSVMVTGTSLFVDAAQGSVEVVWEELQSA
ncbi:YaeQ family protein [Vibrio sp. SCSIO 43135]|uniref:YaeQ family protein n=1 Tax=Vibrio paucivorans TaxID=2829489 RepID=A0A9X3HRG5_9VIBR|nr:MULTISPECIES: YaeQ family protein [Vibrio]MCW8334120.1 YaeQ family protein [Vibrio paucivorans]USD43743.1 YaeQ family protein [Vibrio sp. SCSIO 43135]